MRSRGQIFEVETPARMGMSAGRESARKPAWDALRSNLGEIESRGSELPHLKEMDELPARDPPQPAARLEFIDSGVTSGDMRRPDARSRGGQL
jgi:hypothetical protein